MSEPLIIPVAQADVGRRLDLLLFALVVVAIAVAWLAEPGQPWRMGAFAVVLGLSWLVPRALNGSRRQGACPSGSLCATARIQYRQPAALRIHADGSLFVQWEPDGTWLAAHQLRTLWLGPLLQLAVGTSAEIQQTSASTESASRSLENGSAPDAAAPNAAATQQNSPAGVAIVPPPAVQQRGSCLLWLLRLGADDAAAVRRWLVWRRRGGHAPGQTA